MLTEAERHALTRPTWADAGLGAAVEWSLIAPVVAIEVGLTGVVSGSNPVFGAVAVICSYVIALTVGAAATLICILPAMGIALLLRNQRRRRIHLGAYFALGSVSATLALLGVSPILGFGTDIPALAALSPIILAVGGCAAAGWAISLFVSVRRGSRPQRGREVLR